MGSQSVNNVGEWFAKLSLKQKFIFALVSCSLGTAAFLAVVLTTSASRALRTDVEEKLEAISDSESESLLSSYQKLNSDANGLASTKFIQDALVSYESVAYGTGLDITTDADLLSSPYFKTLETKFSETFNDYLKGSAYNSYSIVLNGGSVVSQTGGSNLVGKNLAAGSVKSSALSSCFTSAKASGHYFTDLVSDYDKKSRAYLCTVIRSKYDRDGYRKDAPMGVLVVDINWDVFNRVSKFESGLGDTGEIFLTSSSGTLKTYPRALAASANLDDLVGQKWTQKLQLTDEMFETVDHSGNQVYSLQKELKLDDGHAWAIVTQEHVSEANESIRSMRLWAIFLLAIAAAAVSAYGWFFAARLTVKFNENSDRLLRSNSDINEVSESVSNIATSVRAGAQQQAAAIHETSVSLEELTQMVLRTTELSNASQGKSQLCESEASTGLGKIESLINSIEGIETSNQVTLDQVDRANDSFQALLHLFNTITTKTQVINDIAFQTKLLSFNASVEAARAGEHGRGFSVVAEEVGKLAISVSAAAGEINSLLSTSSNKMNDTIQKNRQGLQKAASESKDEILASKEFAAECNRFFASLSQMVSDINKEMSQISSATKEQKSGISEINRAVGQISNANEENVQNANSIFTLSTRLQSVVSELTYSNTELETLIQGSNEHGTVVSRVNVKQFELPKKPRPSAGTRAS